MNDHTVADGGRDLEVWRLMVGMRPSADTPHLGALLAQYVARRHGVVSRHELRALGYTDQAIARMIRAGRLHRIHPGVYAVGHPNLTVNARYLAGVLAAGLHAVLSHRSAAALWDLLRSASARVHVTVPATSGRRSSSMLAVHRSRHRPESTVHLDIPVTTPTQTLVDLADTVSDRQLEKAVEQAVHLNLIDLNALRPTPGRRGAARLQRLLAGHDAEHTRTRSELEDALLELCDAHGIPRPRTNVIIEGYEADFAWPEHRLIVETDSWRHHRSRHAFEHDRRRDAHHTAQGWRVVRLTYDRTTNEGGEVAALLTKLTTPRPLPPPAPAGA